MKPLLDEQQPDMEVPDEHPSILIYFLIIILSAACVLLAFYINGGADWPGLLLNISAGLISALVVLTVVERRLRHNELDSLKQMPVKTQMSFNSLISPSLRAAKKYAASQVQATAPLLKKYVELAEYVEQEPHIMSGCNLLADPGAGKTAFIQSIASKKAVEFLESNGNKKIVIVFPLRHWSHSMSDAHFRWL